MIECSTGIAALEQWRIAYLGTKGRLKAAMAGLKDVPREEKPAVGKRVHFTEVETLFEDLQAETLLGRGALTYDD